MLMMSLGIATCVMLVEVAISPGTAGSALSRPSESSALMEGGEPRATDFNLLGLKVLSMVHDSRS